MSRFEVSLESFIRVTYSDKMMTPFSYILLFLERTNKFDPKFTIPSIRIGDLLSI